ncbi:IclR family transcriptional regulator [Halopelagius fulvigenes]|uniref:IclR family transcriptional regulator n=1 Tax=Halopelagius fulvigenes TaxID=1198324 RepID=A0ABD5TZ23_9EURY
MADPTKYTIEATETSLTILEALVDQDGPTGVTALAERVGSSKSVVHNHLSTLEASGYVLKDGTQYRPSLRTLNLGVRTREQLPVFRIAKPLLDNLAAATGETATLFVREEEGGVPVYVVEPSDESISNLREGERLPLPENAPGRAILSTLSDERIDEILDDAELVARTDSTLTDPEELRERVRQIRDSGISFCREEQAEGVVSAAAPIETRNDRSNAALGVYGPADRLQGRYLEEDLTGQILSTAKSVRVTLTNL